MKCRTSQWQHLLGLLSREALGPDEDSILAQNTVGLLCSSDGCKRSAGACFWKAFSC